MSQYIPDINSKKELQLAKKGSGRILGRIKEIPEETFVNDLLEDMEKIDRIFTWMGLEKWTGLTEIIKPKLRNIGFHRRIQRMQDLYEISAYLEKKKAYPHDKATVSDFSEDIKREKEKKEKNERSTN